MQQARSRAVAVVLCLLAALAASGKLVLGGVADGAATSAKRYGRSDLRRLILEPSEVGSGYRTRRFAGYDRVRDQVTLDLCGRRFPSERLRTGRLQFAYTGARKAATASNEVVTYRDGGARQALRELRHTVHHCPRRPVTGPVQGMGPVRYRLKRLTDSRLLPGYVAVLIHVRGNVHGRRIDYADVTAYQVQSNLLSAVYVHGGSLAERRKLCLYAAEQSASKVKRG